jgi:hypothetical protein
MKDSGSERRLCARYPEALDSCQIHSAADSCRMQLTAKAGVLCSQLNTARLLASCKRKMESTTDIVKDEGSRINEPMLKSCQEAVEILYF